MKVIQFTRNVTTLVALLVCLGQVVSGEQPLIGLNLGHVTYFSQEMVFTDLSNHLEPFGPLQDGFDFGQGDPAALTFGPDGLPTSIRDDHSAAALLIFPFGYPRQENHVILWDGNGEVDFLFGQEEEIVSRSPGRLEIKIPDLPPGDEAIDGNTRGIIIGATNPSDPVRNLRIVPVSQETNYSGSAPTNPFRQQFLDRWQWSGSFRYKDWATIDEDPPITDWSSRPDPNHFTQGRLNLGVALEHQINHANITGTHPWITIPHSADDDFVRNAAILIRDSLDDGLAVRVEYSNEVWNTIFPQYDYARQMASSIGESQDFTGAMRYYAHRSGEIFDIFEEVFTENGTNPGGRDRMVKVLGAFAGWEYVAQEVLSYGDVAQSADAVAIAPYFGGAIAADPDEFGFDEGSRNTQDWLNATWEERIGWVEADLQTSLGFMDTHMNILQNNPEYNHLKLFAYEGGQHYVGHYDAYQDQAFTALMQELNQRPEMQEFYREYLEHWFEIGGEDFILYNALTASTIYGNWGLLEYEGQPAETAPKLLGVLEFLEANQVPEPSSAILLPTAMILVSLYRDRYLLGRKEVVIEE